LIGDIKKYIEPYLTTCEPIDYKGLKLKPVKIKDFFTFKENSEILMIEKNRIADINVITMSYLSFIFQLILTNEEWKNKFICIMGMCLGAEFDESLLMEEFPPNEILFSQIDEDKADVYINGYPISFKYNDGKVESIEIMKININPTEFDDIIRLILYQNVNDYDDNFMTDDVRKAVTEYYELKNRNKKDITLNDKIIEVMRITGRTKKDILDMTIIDFNKLFSSNLDYVEYFIGCMALCQGAKCDVEHWLYKSDKQKFSDVFSSASDYTNKINHPESTLGDN